MCSKHVIRSIFSRLLCLSLISVFDVSCAIYEDNQENEYEDVITDYLNDNNRKELILALSDTSYVFRIDDIENISYHENEDIRKGKTFFSESNFDISGQSCISFNDTIIAFNTGGKATAISMISKERVSFTPESTTFHPHCNVANHYYYKGKHYVYLSEWDGLHRCFVEELSYNELSKKWSSRLVQIISLNVDDSIRGVGNMDWIVDQDNEKLYVQTYKDGTSENATGLIYLEFPLVAPMSSKTVTFTTEMVLRRIEHPMIYITQDKEIYNNKLYVASGWGGNYPGKVTVIDLDSFNDCFVYNLGELNDEPEGLFIYKDNLMVTYWSNNYFVQNKESIFIHFNNNICLSYPLESIRMIYFN